MSEAQPLMLNDMAIYELAYQDMLSRYGKQVDRDHIYRALKLLTNEHIICMFLDLIYYIHLKRTVDPWWGVDTSSLYILPIDDE